MVSQDHTRPGPAPAGARRVTGPAAFAAAAAFAALFPGATAALMSLVLAGATLLFAARRFLGRRAPRPWFAATLALVVGGAVAVELVTPIPSPANTITEAARQVERRWRLLLGQFDAAVGHLPAAGYDRAWLGERERSLGPRSGAELLDAQARAPIAWSGWTTPLDPDEREVLLSRLEEGPALVVLRRGLTIRLLYARWTPGAPRQIVAVEWAMPPEPDAGFLTAGLNPSVHGLVRWEALGEGLRAAVETEEPAAQERTYWSLATLMAGRGKVAGRVSLGVDPAALLEVRRDDARRALAGAALALFLIGAAFAAPGPVALLSLSARLSLVAACPFADRWTTVHRPGAWAESLADALPRVLLRLVHTPVDAALTGLCLLAGAVLAARPRTFGRRRLAAGAGVTLAAAGMALIAAAVLRRDLVPGALLIPAEDWLQRALIVVALVSLPAAGLMITLRAARPSLPFAAVWAAVAAGALAGFVEGATTAAAARRIAERQVLPQLENRQVLWDIVLRATLALTAPSDDPAKLVPERDAIDLWWNSPLRTQGLAAGVWKFGPGGRLEDSFLTGLPPVEPVPVLGADDSLGPPLASREMRGPVPTTLDFLGGASPVLLAEMARPEGGSWIAVVLDEPSNLPGEAAGLSAPLVLPDTQRTRLWSPFLTPHLAWFDGSGRVLGADPAVSPPAPVAPPPAPRWRFSVLDGRPVQILEAPDSGGTVTLTFFTPTGLARWALVVDRAIVVAAIALLLSLLRGLAPGPRAAARTAAAWLRQVAPRFRVQALVFLVGVGLLPLAALGVGGRVVAARQARLQLMNEGARTAHIARRLVEDYLRLTPGGPAALTDSVAAWLARTIGDDLFAWRDGTILATSRPDLIVAGWWPERLEGETWRAIAAGRVPLVVEPQAPSDAATRPSRAVVHGPYRAPDGQWGVLTIPLSRIGRRIEEGLVVVDQALLVSAALLVVLAGLLVTHATRRLLRPLAELEQAASQIAGGDFGAAVPEGGYEETRTLAHAFREMAASLAEQRRSLEQRRAAIETLINRMPVAVLAISADGTVYAGNPTARELLGATAGGRLPRGGDPLLAVVRRLAGGAGETIETIERGAAAGTRRFRAAGIDLPGLVEGAPVRLVIVEDLTDAVRSERLAAWAEMARRIAHEIKNPLTPISLVVEHVRRLIEERDPRLPEVLDAALGTIADQVHVLRETSREFSDYARILVARREPLDLPRDIPAWLAAYVLAPPAGIAVRVDGPEHMPPVMADPRLLRRALINLVDNALAAVAPPGRITVRWSFDAAPPAAARISVEDDGPGIEPSRVPGLFEPGGSTRATGSGLGLPIAQQAALAHGGRIEVETAVGRGARFTIVLPAAGAANGEQNDRGADDAAAPPPGADRES